MCVSGASGDNVTTEAEQSVQFYNEHRDLMARSFQVAHVTQPLILCVLPAERIGRAKYSVRPKRMNGNGQKTKKHDGLTSEDEVEMAAECHAGAALGHADGEARRDEPEDDRALRARTLHKAPDPGEPTKGMWARSTQVMAQTRRRPTGSRGLPHENQEKKNDINTKDLNGESLCL